MSEDPIREEIQSHLEQRRQWLKQHGQDPDAAHRRFGNTAHVYEETRRVHVPAWLELAIGDLRYAWRSFRRTPVFTITALAVLTIGLGSAAAVFSVVDRILFRPLPYADESRLVWLGMSAPISGDKFVLGSDYRAWKLQQQVFTSMTSFQGRADCTLQLGQPVLTSCASVEWNFLPVLGMSVQRGRNFSESDEKPGTPPVALIADRVWRQHFGASETAVGRKVTVDGQMIEIAGVLPADFELPTLARPGMVLVQQIDWASQVRGQSTILMQAVARLKPGISRSQAESMMLPLLAEAMHFVPERFRKEVAFHVEPLRERQVRDARQASLLLLGAVACLLLIGCLNVANLLVARMETRRQELATRAALGAGRWDLIRQLLLESLLLGAAGAISGLAMGWALLRVAVTLSPAGIPRLSDASVDPRVALAVAACAILAAVVAGVWPAISGVRANWQGSERATRPGRVWARQFLVALQLGASLVLLAGAGLLSRSLLELQQVHLGIRTADTYSASLVLDRVRYSRPEQRVALVKSIERAVSAVPGVQAASVSDSLPPKGSALAMIFSNIGLEGKPAIPQGTGGMVLHRVVTPGYFKALGIPILRGRAFLPEDEASGTALIVDERAAQKMFPGEDALGRRVKLPQRGPWLTIVGIAANARNNGLTAESDPEYYEVWTQTSQPRFLHVAIVTPLGPAAAAEILRKTIWQLDSAIAIEVQTLNARVDALREQPRFQAAVLGFFAASGLVIAVVGLYGVVAYLVARRTREIGIRVAVGASPGAILSMVFGQALAWICGGLAAGLAAAWLMARTLQAVLFGVEPRDPGALAGAAGLLLAAALAAVWLPARRASRLDPSTALRTQ